MTRESFRNITVGSLLMMVAMFALSTSAKAQSLSSNIRAKIPFDFAVGDKKLPSGDYFIGNTQATSDIAITIRGNKRVANVLTIPAQVGIPTDAAKLIFHRYGNQYFLFQVWQAGARTGRTVRKSDAERNSELAAHLSAPLGAATRNIVETVTILAYAR